MLEALMLACARPASVRASAVSLVKWESRTDPFPGDARTGSVLQLTRVLPGMFASVTKTPVGILPANSRRGACATSRGTWRRVWTPYSSSGLAAVYWAQLRRIEMSATNGAIAAPCAVFLRHGACVVTGYRMITIRAGGVSGGYSREDDANRAGDTVTWRTTPASRTKGTSAYERHRGELHTRR